MWMMPWRLLAIELQKHFFFFQAEDGIRDHCVTGVQTCALPISSARARARVSASLTFIAFRFGMGDSSLEGSRHSAVSRSRLRRAGGRRGTGLVGAEVATPGRRSARRSEERRVGKE